MPACSHAHELAPHKWNDGSMHCVICGFRIVRDLVAYALKNGAVLASPETPR